MEVFFEEPNDEIPEDSEILAESEPNSASDETINKSRRGFIIGTSAFVALGVAGMILNPKWALKSSAQTVPPPPITPVDEVDPIPTPDIPDPEPTIDPNELELAQFKLFMISLNTSLLNSRSLSMIHAGSEEFNDFSDWENIKRSWDFWGANNQLMESRMTPAPLNLLLIGLDPVFIAAKGTATEVPSPIGFHRYPNETFRITDEHTYEWVLADEADGYVFYALAIDGKLHERALSGIEKFKSADITPFPGNLTSSAEYEFIRGRELSSQVTDILNRNPELGRSIVISPLDGGFVIPQQLFQNTSLMQVIGQEGPLPNVRILGDEDATYSVEFSTHSALSNSIILGNGRYPGLLGNNAGVDILTKGAIGALLTERIKNLKSGQPLPLTIIDRPYHINMTSISEIVVGDVTFDYSSVEFLKLMRDLNVIVIYSFGNTMVLYNKSQNAFDFSDPEVRELFFDTHLIATKGKMSVDGKDLLMDIYKGLPAPDNFDIMDATFVAPGFFPAMSFSTYHISNKGANQDSRFRAFRDFDNGILPVETYGSGSSFAVTCLASQLYAYGLVHMLKEQRQDIPAYEILRRFRTDMKPHAFSAAYPNKGTINLNLRTVDNDLIIRMLNEVNPHYKSRHLMPKIAKNSN